jgi:hypothetical protein
MPGSVPVLLVSWSREFRLGKTIPVAGMHFGGVPLAGAELLGSLEGAT